MAFYSEHSVLMCPRASRRCLRFSLFFLVYLSEKISTSDEHGCRPLYVRILFLIWVN